jgi:restriction system protein
MPIPDYESLMRPVLEALSDGQERPVKELRDLAAASQGITEEERAVPIPSGTQSLFGNRINWAITYLVKAGLVARLAGGIALVTDRGRKVLAEHPGRIDNSVLEEFPEFIEFKTTKHVRTTKATAQAVATASALSGSPTEAIQSLVDEVNGTVAAEVLERVLANPPVFLERLILRLLEAMGYGGVEAMSEHLGGPGDEGLDGVIRQDALGLDVVCVQAKRYTADRRIGRPDIQAFVGALNGARADRGIFITTSGFTPDAKAFVSRAPQRLVLIDGPTLAKEMVRRNVGVDVRDVYEVKRIDEDFFEET